MRKLLFILIFLTGSLLYGQTTLNDTVPSVIISVDELITKARILYDEADKLVGKIDSVFCKGVLVVVSWDSAGIRKRFITYTDSLSLGLFK